MPCQMLIRPWPERGRTGTTAFLVACLRSLGKVDLIGWREAVVPAIGPVGLVEGLLGRPGLAAVLGLCRTPLLDKAQDRVVGVLVLGQDLFGRLRAREAAPLPQPLQPHQGPAEDGRELLFELVDQVRVPVRPLKLLPELDDQQPPEKSVAVVSHPGEAVGGEGQLAERPELERSRCL